MTGLQETHVTVAYPPYFERKTNTATLLVVIHDQELGRRLYTEASPLNNLSLRLQHRGFKVRPSHDADSQAVSAIACTFACSCMADILERADDVKTVMQALGIEAQIKWACPKPRTVN